MAERNLEQTVKVREAVAQDLLGGRINLLLGWEKGHYWWQSRPLFARTEKDLEKLVWDSFCAVNLSRYLLDELKDHDKIGVLSSTAYPARACLITRKCLQKPLVK